MTDFSAVTNIKHEYDKTMKEGGGADLIQTNKNSEKDGIG